MPCGRCAVVPDSHCFLGLGTHNGITYFYTSPPRGHDYKETPDTLAYYKAHLDEAKTHKWIWIIDCKEMKAKHYSSPEMSKQMVKYLSTEHRGQLKEIWIINPNTWIRGLVAIIKPFFNKEITDRLQIIPKSGLELYMELETRGMNGYPCRNLVTIVNTPYVPGLLPKFNY
jgi:hypothetical protein